MTKGAALPDSQQIVILGAGIGGEVVAHQLSKQLGNKALITIIERRSSFTFPPAYNWMIFGDREPSEVQRSSAIGKRRNVRVINREADKIDLRKHIVKTGGEELHYDKLIIALGADLASNTIPGIEKYSNTFYDFEGAVKLRSAVENFQNGKIGIAICGLPIKCPPAPYELGLLLQDHLQRLKKKAEIEIFTTEPQPLPSAGAVIGRQVERLLAARGIKYHPKTRLDKLDVQNAFFQDGTKFEYDLFITVPPHQPPKIVRDAGLTDESGWIPVNPYNLTTKHEDVYAIGDVVSIETPHGHAPFLPKAGVFAQGQAEILANNLAVSITGEGQAKQWDGSGECYLQVSKSESAMLRGTFLSNPPRLEFHPARRKWFLAKEGLEKRWMSKQL
jgi:sulfide:quinone oxidoreductase